METVNQIATSAIKVIWGEGDANQACNQEPISGATGDVSRGEPYDAGNMESDMSGNENANSHANFKPAPTPSTDTPAETKEQRPDAQSSTSLNRSTESEPPTDQTKNRMEEPEAEISKENVEHKSSDGGPIPEIAKSGPRPVAEIAKEHGGDAAAASTGGAEIDTKQVGSNNEKQETELGKHDSKKHEGSGEQYVKTTGLAADGGDFDATKPGAGREADRLMEEKGMHLGDSGTLDDNKTSASGHNKDKPSLGERIKNKLHKH